ncbi:hypothetical protein BJ170DRAFT_598079 [Xylariales sp. AK1849]|nr:hypothetical protein BJ170DRAFT_598079 [Xylariales sp. AK1849]
MSQPPYLYSPYPGQQFQQPYQYPPPPPIQSADSYYGTPQEPNPAAVAGNFASTNESFEYNGSRIPGLGMGAGPPAALPPSYRPENRSVWPPSAFGGTSSSVAPPNIRKQGIVGLQEPHLPHSSERSAGFASAKSPAIQTNDEALEEGELSDEGQFEDLYEPRESLVGSAKGRPQQTNQSTGLIEDLSGSIGDADGSSIYDTGSTREEVVIDSTSASLPAGDEEEEEYSPGEYEPEYQERERSGSYSPYLSPSEVRPGDSTSHEAKQSPSLHQSLPSFAASGAGTKQTLGNAVLSNDRTSPDRSPPGRALGHSELAEAALAPKPSYKSVAEARKKAQEAILGLWPLKVRYQDYLQEGIDAQVIKLLFTDLGLDVSPPKPVAPLSKTSVNPQPIPSTTLQAEHTTSPKPSETTTPSSTALQLSKLDTDKSTAKSDEKMADKKSAQEERKDKIARMLAEKSKKSSTVAVVSTKPATVTAPSALVATATTTSNQTDLVKAKTKAENTLKLQQKLALLRKAQEEAEAKKKQDLAKQAGITAIVEDRKSPVTTIPVTTATIAVSTAQQHEQASSSGDPDASTPTGITELSVSTTPQPTSKNRNLKRPVASDFDGYSTNGGTSKRTRTQDTLIIDVSDDEDVEMDIGSPTDGPISAIQSNNILTRQNTLGTFPPLTNSYTWRGPISSPVTPGPGTPGHGHKLDFLTQKIEEAKRRIAEAEAKKAAKKPNGVSTPWAQSPAPILAQSPARPLLHIQSARLPKVAEVVKVERDERRVRIASYHLPVVEAALREKQDRLKRLQLEAAQLELEVKASLNERQELTAEMEDLEDDTTTESNKPNSQVESPYSNLEAVPQLAQPDVTVEAAVDLGSAVPNNPQPIADEVIEEHKPPGDKSDMDIDSSDSSAGDDVPDIDTTANAAVIVHDEPRRSLSRAPLASHTDDFPAANVYDAIAIAPIGGDEADTIDSTRAISKEAEAQDPTDTDIRMQSVGEIMASDEDYEPHPAQISGIEKVQISEGEDGEVAKHPQPTRSLLIADQILDDDPFEPSPAQLSNVITEAAPAAPTDEVQLRSLRKPRLLMIEQAKSQNKLTARDLLTYESPLRYFHAYRFHPQYLDDVSGGLKSMTYSSRIDITRPLCPFVVDGGQCPNGSSCEFQHFDKMVLSDTEIIAELGSTDMYAGEQKGRFIDGLKTVLHDLKANKVKDFDRITKAIVQYRASFLEDKSKVLPLNNVTI